MVLANTNLSILVKKKSCFTASSGVHQFTIIQDFPPSWLAQLWPDELVA